MATIQVNGTNTELTQAMTVSELLQHLAYDSKFIAVAVNQSCVSRKDYQAHVVKPGDVVEILSPMSGG
jgi:thiamine biosynthesis protein ThiS